MVTQISYFTLDSNLILTKSQRLIEKLRWREDNLCKSDYKIIVFLLLKRRNNRIMAMDFKKPNKTKQTSESGSVGQPWHESVFMRQGHLSASKRENDKKTFWIHGPLNIKVQIPWTTTSRRLCVEYYWNCRLDVLSQHLHHCLLWDGSFPWTSVTILLLFSWLWFTYLEDSEELCRR